MFKKINATLAVFAVSVFAAFPAMAGVAEDAQPVIDSMVADASSVITVVGLGVLAIAGVAFVFKWAKSAFTR